MSIELLPPTQDYPNDWHVRTNYCNCHPETCCCNDWAVHDPEGKKQSTHYLKFDAESFAELMRKST